MSWLFLFLGKQFIYFFKFLSLLGKCQKYIFTIQSRSILFLLKRNEKWMSDFLKKYLCSQWEITRQRKLWPSMNKFTRHFFSILTINVIYIREREKKRFLHHFILNAFKFHFKGHFNHSHYKKKLNKRKVWKFIEWYEKQ